MHCTEIMDTIFSATSTYENLSDLEKSCLIISMRNSVNGNMKRILKYINYNIQRSSPRFVNNKKAVSTMIIYFDFTDLLFKSDFISLVFATVHSFMLR